jgi:hypothetical protein
LVVGAADCGIPSYATSAPKSSLPDGAFSL